MTCILALKDERGIVVGADSLEVQGQFLLHDARKKIFIHNDLIIGTAGHSKLGTVMHCLNAELTYKHSGTTPFNFVVSDFVPQMKEVFKKHGMLQEEHKIEDFDGTILLAFGQSIFVIHSDGAITESETGFAAIGSGQEVASGAYGMWEKIGKSGDDREKLAYSILAVVENFIMGVRRPFYILKTWEIQDTEPAFEFGSESKTSAQGEQE